MLLEEPFEIMPLEMRLQYIQTLHKDALHLGLFHYSAAFTENGQEHDLEDLFWTILARI